jgi:hypothetical protein
VLTVCSRQVGAVRADAAARPATPSAGVKGEPGVKAEPVKLDPALRADGKAAVKPEPMPLFKSEAAAVKPELK